jgi:hypothetical protein
MAVCYDSRAGSGGVIGSHARLKILWPQGRAGSIPAPSTISFLFFVSQLKSATVSCATARWRSG